MSGLYRKNSKCILKAVVLKVFFIFEGVKNCVRQTDKPRKHLETHSIGNLIKAGKNRECEDDPILELVEDF